MDLTYGTIQMNEPLELSAQFLYGLKPRKAHISAQLLLLFLILFKECIKYDSVVILGSITIQSLKIFSHIVFKLGSVIYSNVLREVSSVQQGCIYLYSKQHMPGSKILAYFSNLFILS